MASARFRIERALGRRAQVIEVRADDDILIAQARGRGREGRRTTFCVGSIVDCPACATGRATNFCWYVGRRCCRPKAAYWRARYAAAESLPGVPVRRPASFSLARYSMFRRINIESGDALLAVEPTAPARQLATRRHATRERQTHVPRNPRTDMFSAP